MYITDRAYTEKDIMKMELNILHGLEFNLGRPLALHFLRYSLVVPLGPKFSEIFYAFIISYKIEQKTEILVSIEKNR